jgi:hypothetical protein
MPSFLHFANIIIFHTLFPCGAIVIHDKKMLLTIFLPQVLCALAQLFGNRDDCISCHNLYLIQIVYSVNRSMYFEGEPMTALVL